jgi:hypothetical protein
MLAVAWPFGCPPRFTGPGGGQTRLAQTLPAFSPLPVALLGHATRPGGPEGMGEATRRAQTRAAKCEECLFLGASRQASDQLSEP